MENTEERMQVDKGNESKSTEQGCGPLVWLMIVVVLLFIILLAVSFGEGLYFLMLLFGIGAIVYCLVMGLFR